MSQKRYSTTSALKVWVTDFVPEDAGNPTRAGEHVPVS
jgi:hypothetical protein